MKFYTDITRKGSHLYVRSIDNGIRDTQKVKFKPSLYVKTNNPAEAVSQTLSGEMLSEKRFNTIGEMNQWKKQYKDIEGFEIYGDVDPVWQYVSKTYSADIDFDPTFIKISNFDIEVHSPDEFPDPDDALYPVTAISVQKNRKHYTFALDNKIFGGTGGEWKPSLSILKEKGVNPEDVIYEHFYDETSLLQAFLDFWVDDYCDVITGWNIDGFDINYIVNRVTRLLGEISAKKLSPHGILSSRTFHDERGMEKISWKIGGIAILDYLDLYKKYTYSKPESYKLDHIAYVELEERKLSYDDMSGLHELYIKDFQKYIDYNIQDENLVQRIDDKMKLFDIVFTVAFLARINFADTNSPVRTWDALIYQFLGKDNIQVPPLKRNDKRNSIPGGYVKPPIIGRHGWVVSFDLASLYPSLVRQYNLGTETHVPIQDLPDEVRRIIPEISEAGILSEKIDLSVLKKYDLSMSANAQFWRKDKKSFFSALMESLYTNRKEWKGEMLEWKDKKEKSKDSSQTEMLKGMISRFNNKQMAAKILMNAGYGAMTNQYFRYYKDEMAQAITLSGQLTIKWAEQSFNRYLQELFKDDKDRVIAGDTDSNYLGMQDLVDKVFPKGGETEKIVSFLDKVCEKKLYPHITEQFTSLYEYMNAYQNLMIMEREAIAESAVWTGKKHYFMKIWDNEGVAYQGGKMKMTGMEAVKSSTPEIGRKKLKESYQLILDGDQKGLIDLVKEFKTEWLEKSIVEIATPSGLKTLDKFKNSETIYGKGTTLQARSALLYNYLLKKHKLPYPEIKQGTDIRMVYLKMPNPIRENVIGFIDFLPEEFGLHEYVDYDATFNKNYLSYLELVTSKIGWHWEERSSLDDFFS